MITLKDKLQHYQLVQEALQQQEIDFKNEKDFQLIVAILKKEKASRRLEELQVLEKGFSQIKFFQEMTQHMGNDFMLALYKELKYQTLKKRENVFNFGDIGRHFYIILRGSVLVLVKSTLNIEQELDSHIEKSQKKNIQQRLSQHQLSQDTIHQLQKQLAHIKHQEKLNEFALELSEEKFIDYFYPKFQKFGVIQEKGSFGEIALSKQIPRTATIVCQTDIHIATLSREAFHKFLCKITLILKTS